MVRMALWLIVLTLFCRSAHAWSPSDSEQLVAGMEAAYAKVRDYRTRLIISGFGRDESFQSRQELIYRFKKPNKLRIDFIAPHSGMTILYPALDGKVLVKPSGWASLFALHLDTRNPLLEISPGQHINQTDYGTLIANIRHSLTDMFLGDLQVEVSPSETAIRVLSDHPFRRGTPSHFIFVIDNHLSLPVQVTEVNAQGEPLLTVEYRDIQINTGVSETLFTFVNPRRD
jgi:outer membrane lipoprotein-sorting protein